MSWLARSLANSLQLDDQHHNNNNHPTTSTTTTTTTKQQFNQTNQQSNSQTLTSGVQEDLSEFTESLSRQIWGVASFLAPPPPPPPPPPLRHRTPTESDRNHGNSGIGDADDDDVSDLISPIDGSDLLRFEDGDGDRDVKDLECVGVTDEVLVFATNVAHHPETWLDFPLSEEEDSDDFEMSDTQWNHATLVEHLVPRLAALRIELCPIHMSESYFWKVYFVLLHPRLSKHDADLLSTPQIVAARAMWMKELQKQSKPGPESFDSHTLDHHEDFNTTSSDSPIANASERTTHAFEPATYNTVSEEQPDLTKEDGSTSTKDASDQRVVSSFTMPPIEDFDDDEDDWIHENSELDGYDGPDVPIGAEEDISFSDLEDDDCMKFHNHLK
ncbi:putative BSD domain-containing protein [Helianthus annuus]|uniref:BSD domain-containing protein n=1 Tax=Helianthus annuus TaxID=4232 RepID=A0A251SCG4_HELAN|nr:lateral signaling target protein 2 homolog [Helianthus annuus]KAF5766723.1 putative BSD domain-containing protein [Helianthus annuus]KAJ0453071.1 putative BSD domain-containing protein [Helianthus annuus]KAJ0474982.1 putative BSD domain-containing protein [Helianthus annuus]KAJ0650537.1 putative BSD domain-containing protein [Helianthus annuus]KAJ0654289.1 putative BSD domain-containing protein [Helianthus annuus]